MEAKYLINDWKNYIYIILTNIAKGYWYFSQFQYPIKKQNMWVSIDKKILQKYQINIGKDKRYRRKKKGLANYLFYRWEKQCILLKTEGTKLPQDDEPWSKLQGKNKIIIPIGNIVLEIRNINNKYSVKLSKDSYREIKAEIIEKLSKKQLNYAIKIFNNLNGLPNYKFLFVQKVKIRNFFIKEVKKHLGNVKNIKDKLIIKKTLMRKGKIFIE